MNICKRKAIDEYFGEFERDSNCETVNQITGIKYNFLEDERKGEIQRFFIDENIDASISKIKSKKKGSFNYIDKSDLLIIGFCLDGEKTINYKGENTIGKGEVFYFRPTEDFTMNSSGHSFLNYFIDLSYFKESLCCNKRGRGCKKLYCNSYGELICNRGQLIIEKVPYAMKAYGDEIRKIKDIEVDDFLEYTSLKGQLFNYLNWFIRLRLSKDSSGNKKRPSVCYATQAKRIIIDNLEEGITVNEIAEKLDISTYRLQKSFKKKEHTTVYNYIRKAKMDHSKVLLRDSDLSIIDISQRIGYENPSKYSAAFNDITGYTPTEYRELGKD